MLCLDISWRIVLINGGSGKKLGMVHVWNGVCIILSWNKQTLHPVMQVWCLLIPVISFHLRTSTWLNWRSSPTLTWIGSPLVCGVFFLSNVKPKKKAHLEALFLQFSLGQLVPLSSDLDSWIQTGLRPKLSTVNSFWYSEFQQELVWLPRRMALLLFGAYIARKGSGQVGGPGCGHF